LGAKDAPHREDTGSTEKDKEQKREKTEGGTLQLVFLLFRHKPCDVCALGGEEIALDWDCTLPSPAIDKARNSDYSSLEIYNLSV
jgi:hypothetical protein